MSNITSNARAKEIVLSFITALNNDDSRLARKYISDDLKFISVLGTHDGADAYFQDMERMRLKYDIKKVFVDERDVCLFYDITISDVTIFACGWYEVKEGKISKFQVVFDSRAILEASRK
ncbi:MAG: nuclear transport factor 2 family protein [Chitinophagaceae bacterium]|nr:nuclear transport factor 2 family protein [Chitinophagaceae bacterium]